VHLEKKPDLGQMTIQIEKYISCDIIGVKALKSLILELQ